ncbi:MAG: hypothetical protein ACE149_14675 [Armatimonadota bacterium]
MPDPPCEATACAPPRVGWSERRPLTAAFVYVLSYLAVAVAGGAALTLARQPLAAGVVVTAIGAAVLLMSLLLVLSICRLQLGPWGEAAGVVATLIVFSLVRPSMYTFVGKLLGRPGEGAEVTKALSAVVTPGMTLLLGNTVLIIWASFLGKLVSRIIREGKLILPIAVVGCIVDTITVFWGVVAHVSKTAPEVVETFSAAAPVAPPPNVQAPILSAVGIGDFLFYAMFLAIALRHSMRPAATMWATFAVMLMAPVAFYFFPSATGLPGLPWIGLAALWANWRFMRFTREEVRSLLVVGLLVLAAAFAIWAALHR